MLGPKLPPETDAIIDRVLQSDLPEMVTGESGYAVSAGGVKIWYESITPHSESKGVVLLNIAMGGDALGWEPSFLRAFVEAGYQTIRYDYRSTGMSDWIKDWNRKQPYTLADMAGDALAVLDVLKVEKAHLVGYSMGGMIAQEIAIANPARVTSLTLIMTSGFIGDPDLPSITSRYFLTLLAKGLPLLKYRIRGGEKNLIKERIAKMLTVMPPEAVNIKETAEVVLYDLRKRRGIHLRAPIQHQAAVSQAGSRYEKLKTLTLPTLIIHGTDDQFIPVEHGMKLAEVIPNAKTMWIEGAGHIFPLPNMDKITQNIMAHLAGAG